MPLRYVRDLGAARWIAERLHPFAQDVGSVVPPGFEDYARIFHPAGRGGIPVSWREIAEANGRTVHREMQFANISGTWSRRSPQPSLWTEDPVAGSLTLPVARHLVSVLRVFTSTPRRCWFGVWEGYGDLEVPADLPRFLHPGRGYFLAEGPIEDATRSASSYDGHYRSANLWWPEDRAWCVASEIDLAYTYVGGATECVERLLAHPGIEALRARLSDDITMASDTVNAPPRPPR